MYKYKLLKIIEEKKVIHLLQVFLKLFYCCSITVVCIFSPPLPHTPSKPTSLPCFHPLLGFVYMSFIVVPENPSTHCPPPTSGYC